MAAPGDIITIAVLEEVILAYLSSTWEDVTVGGSYAAEGSPHEPQVRKIGTRVVMQGGIDDTGLSTSTNHTAVMTVPAGYEPSKPIRTLIPGTTVATACRAVINTDGTIDLGTASVLATQYLFDQVGWDTA